MHLQRPIYGLFSHGGRRVTLWKHRRNPLKDTAGIRRELGRVYRAARSGDLEPADASRLAFILKQLRECVEVRDFEERIAALEAAQAGGHPGFRARVV